MIDLNIMKCETFDAALNYRLDVLDEYDSKIAELIPIGKWALKDDDLLNSFASWRKTFMRFFLTQFNASKESTANYLKNTSIAESNRVFFAIYVERKLIGHIGLSNITARKAELDNIIRGVSGGNPDVMYFAEKTLLSWAFQTINIQSVNAQVMSKNFMALSLHERLGFKLKERHFLRKFTREKSLSLEICEENFATEKFFLDIIEVSGEDFYTSIELT